MNILEGLSGSPVYFEENVLIGMNRSIPYLKGGENPFKTVYFITIDQILNYLRNSGCILYDLSEDRIKIRWIKSKDNSKDNSAKENISILVIGGSGAGKSSFINKFALHNDFMDASGDGQTTRTDVEYRFSLYEREPRAIVKFLNKEKFKIKRTEAVLLNIINFLFSYRFGFELADLLEDELVYFKQIRNKLSVLEQLTDNARKKEINEILDFTIEVLSATEVNDIEDKYFNLLDMLERLLSMIDRWKWKYIFNERSLNEIYYRLIESELEMHNEGSSSELDSIVSRLKKEEISLWKSESEILQDIVLGIYKIDNFEDCTETRDDYSKDTFCDIFTSQKGFFSLKEFEFVITKEFSSDYRNLVENLFDDCILERQQNEFSLQYQLNDRVEKIFDFLYEKIIENIRSYLSTNFFHLNESKETLDDEITFCFFEVEEDEKVLLSKCLKPFVVNLDKYIKRSEKRTDSLTGIIEKVTIIDSFCNDFALLFDELKINCITFLDTHGLDHIEKGVKKRELLEEFISERKEERENRIGKAQRGIDAVFYVKKLDSGRPTELETILPLIYEIEPQISLYCIFTGIDIFLNDKNVERIHWKEYSSFLPKSVQYLFSSEFEISINNKLQFSEKRNQCIYRTLTKNIGAFCNIEDAQFLSSNIENIKRILVSIIIKEKDSIDIISSSLISELRNTSNMDDTNALRARVKNELKRLIYLFFKTASVTNWSIINGNTAKANARRINKEVDEKQLGYKGTESSQYRWDLVFNKAYNKIFSKCTGKLVRTISKNTEKIESIFINLREDFLGKSVDIYMFKNNDNEFKKNLIKLYEGKTENPFNDSKNEIYGDDKDKARKYLEEVYNFYKLITSNEMVLECLVDLIYEKFICALEHDRELSMSNLLLYSENIENSIISSFEEVSSIFNLSDKMSSSDDTVFFDIVKHVVKKSNLLSSQK